LLILSIILTANKYFEAAGQTRHKSAWLACRCGAPFGFARGPRRSEARAIAFSAPVCVACPRYAAWIGGQLHFSSFMLFMLFMLFKLHAFQAFHVLPSADNPCKLASFTAIKHLAATCFFDRNYAIMICGCAAIYDFYQTIIW
jgi:hypothetical protein